MVRLTHLDALRMIPFTKINCYSTMYLLWLLQILFKLWISKMTYIWSWSTFKDTFIAVVSASLKLVWKSKSFFSQEPWNKQKFWNYLHISNISMVKQTHMMAHRMKKKHFLILVTISDTIGFEACIKRFGWITTFCRHAIEFWCSSKQLWQLNLQYRKMCLSNWENFENVNFF